METTSNFVIVLFSLFFLTLQGLFFYWVFKKKFVLKIYGLFFDFSSKEQLFSFFENLKKEEFLHDSD